MLNKKEAYYYAWAALDKLTFPRYQKILAFFGTLEKAWKNLSTAGLIGAGLEPSLAEEIFTLSQKISPEAELEQALKLGVTLFTLADQNYPLLLKEISAPPVFLYCRGKLLPEEKCFAVVGSRKSSSYGKQVCNTLVTELAAQGLTIVSGLALGIDSLAHQAALNAGGRTIAILGNGLDQIYPRQNQNLGAKILENGAILSEFPLGTPPHHYNFPRRNRLISGLSLGALIIEAQNQSGSLITAQYAIEQNREVFAIPGSIFQPNSAGANRLIQKGEAKLVTTASEILEELNLPLFESQTAIKKINLTENLNLQEQQILEILAKEPIVFDDLILQSRIPAAALATTLTLLEMKGLVRNMGHNQWLRVG